MRELAAYGCLTAHARGAPARAALDDEDHTKDIDFSRAGIRARWEAGFADTRRSLAARPGRAPSDPLEGFVLHEQRREAMPVAG